MSDTMFGCVSGSENIHTRPRTQGLSVVLTLRLIGVCGACDRESNIFTEILFGLQFTSSYLVQTEIQKLDGFENKNRGLVGVDVLHIPASGEQLRVRKHTFNPAAQLIYPIRVLSILYGHFT